MDIPVMLDRLRVDVAGEIADGLLDLNMIVTPAPTPQTSSNYTGATTTYIVQQGQELGLIAKDYNVSIQDIMALNDISNPDVIYPGQELIIPAAGEYVPEAPPPRPASADRLWFRPRTSVSTPIRMVRWCARISSLRDCQIRRLFTAISRSTSSTPLPI